MNKESNYREILSERLLEFACLVIKLDKELCDTYTGKHIYSQLFRSASSSGANYQESIAAESKADFIHKIQVVLKELRESNYWIKLIIKTNVIHTNNSTTDFLFKESNELIKIFSSTLITLKTEQGK